MELVIICKIFIVKTFLFWVSVYKTEVFILVFSEVEESELMCSSLSRETLLIVSSYDTIVSSSVQGTCWVGVEYMGSAGGCTGLTMQSSDTM